MYLATADRRVRRTLGQVMPYGAAAAAAQQAFNPPWYYWLFPPAAGVYEAKQAYNLVNAPGTTAGGLVKSAVTGAPTDAQIAANTQSCVAAIQRMRQVNPGTIPDGAENQCAIDQQAYVKSIGGTAEQILAGLIPSMPSVDTSAIWILALAGAGIFLVAR